MISSMIGKIKLRLNRFSRINDIIVMNISWKICATPSIIKGVISTPYVELKSLREQGFNGHDLWVFNNHLKNHDVPKEKANKWYLK